MSEWSALSLNEGVFDGETFCTYTLRRAEVVAESWLCHFNALRSYGPLGYKPPAPELPAPIMITRAVLQPRRTSSSALVSRLIME